MRDKGGRSAVQTVKSPSRLLCGVSAAAVALCAAASPAAAADRWWDPNRAVSGSGGSGDWNTTSEFWSQSNNDVLGPWQAWDNSALDNAIFGTTPAATTVNPPGPITLTTPITVHNMLFQSRNGWELNGGTLTLAGTLAEPIPTITTNGTTTINSVIAGTSGLTKEGTSSLTLTGANTFSGGIFFNAGTLGVSNNAALGDASNSITIKDNVSVTFSATAGQTINRAVMIGSGSTVTVNGGAGSALYTGSGNVTVGAGYGLSNNANTYTGKTHFNAAQGVATSSFTSIGNLGEASSLGAPTTVANGTITWNPGGQYSDNLLYLGDGDSSNRNWSFGGNRAGSFFNDGTGTLILTGDFTLANSAAIGFHARNADLQLLGVISGATGVSFTATALGDLTLGGNNSFTGGASVGGGTAGNVFVSVLADAGVNSSLGAGSTIGLSGVLHYTGAGASTNRTWTAGNGTLLNGGTGALTLTGDVTQTGVLTLSGTYAGTNSISGAISGTGDLASTGSSIWELTGANTRTGAITVSGGTLRAGNASAFGTTTRVTVNGGTLDLNGFDLTAPRLDSTTSGGTIALGGATLTVNATAVDSTYGGAITGTGGLTKTGLRTLALTGSNSYTGPTNINGGTLKADFSLSGAINSDILSAASAVNLSGGGILHIKGAAGEANSQTINGLNILSGANTVRTEVLTGGTLTVNLGAISRTAGLVNFDLMPNGSGNVFLMTTNADGALGGWAMIDNADYAKVVAGRIVAFDDTDYTDLDNAADWDTLGAGQFVSDDDGDAFSFSGTVDNSVQLAGLHYDTAAHSTVNIAPGQTLGIDGAILVTPNVGNFNQTIQGGSITGSASGALGIQHNGTGTGVFTIGSTVVDNGGATNFTKGGSGTVRLTGSNSYTGSTTLSGGTLQINSLANGGVNSAIGASNSDSANLVLEGGTLHYTGATDVTTNRGFTLVNAGLGVPSIRVDGDRTVEFQGQVTSTDDQGLTKTGTGRLTLSNNTNNYVGATTIGTSTLFGGTLSVDYLANGGLASGIGASSAASANLVLQSDGTLEYTGGSVTTDRGFTVGGGNGRIDVTQAGTTLRFGGTVVGGGGLFKDGAGTLELCGTNTYVAGTTVTAGTLRACSTQAFGLDQAGMSVESGATLDLNDFNNTVYRLFGAGTIDLGSATLTTNGYWGGNFTGRITGAGNVFLTGGGFEQIFAGCNNDYTGTTTISGETLQVDCLANGGVVSGIGASTNDPSKLVLQNSGVLRYTGSDQTTDRGFTLANSWGYIDVVAASTELTFTGNVVGPGSLVKRGDGTLVLSGTNSYTGHTQIEAGILRVGPASGLGTGGGYLNMYNIAGAALDLNGSNASFTELRGGGAVGGNIELGSGRVTVTSGGGQTYAGAISGSGGLTKSGSGTQILAGCNSSYSGSTVISGGILSVDCLKDGTVNSAIGAPTNVSGNLVLNGGTLRYTGGTTSTDRLFTLGGASALDASGSGPIIFSNTGAIAFVTPNISQTVTLTGTNTGDNRLAAQITNNGTGATSLSKTGLGTWILTNQGSTYTGVTSITGGGVLGVDKLADGGDASSIGASTNAATNLIIGSGSTLRYTGTGDSTDRLFTLDINSTTIESSGTGAIEFTNNGLMGLSGTGQRTLSLSGSNTGDNIMGVALRNQSATNFTSLAKNGAGKWILTGANTYTGNTNVNQGTLVIGNGMTSGSIASLNSIVAAGGVLGFDRSDTVTYAGTISGAGEVQQLGTGTTVFTGASTYTGGTTILAGTLQLGSGAGGGATGSIVGNVTNNGTLAFNRSNAYQFDGTISGTGQVTQIGTGTTTLTADNSYSGGTTITSGTLQVGNGGMTGSLGTGNVVNIAALIFNRSNDLAFAGLISGSGTLTKLGAGMLSLTGENSYTGGTTITAGTLQIGNGGTGGSIVGDIVNNAALIFNRSNALTYGDDISGTGSLTKLGAGTLTLTGTNSYGGATNVNAGTLLVNGINSGAGLMTVAAGATLGGIGTIAGDVNVDGTLTAGSNGAGTLSIGGNLALGAGSNLNLEFGAANSVGNPLNDLISVSGDLTLDGTLNVSVTSGGSFGAGIYRMFNYGGTLTNNGLAIGTMPMGSDVFVQTAVTGQVNLVNTANLTLNFWDGAAGPKFDSLVNGGDGVWQASTGNDNWTDATGVVNAPYENGAIAIFTAAPGTVTVDNSLGAVTTAGMQFASDGYVLTGDALTLTGATAEIRVGDGSAAGAGNTATINNELTGSSQLVKTDLGTLVLSGTNSYTGGTAISGGTLRISSDTNLGDAAGGLTINGATLHTTADIASARSVNLAGNATFLTNSGTSLTLSGAVSGAGALTKSGDGNLVLAADNSYAGGTTISAGTLQLGDGGATGSVVGNVTNNGRLAFNRSDIHVFAGMASGTGSLDQMGPGTTVLTGTNSYTGGTTISGGTLQLGDGGTTGSIVGDVVNNGTLTFNRSDDVTFAGLISGSGGLDQGGGGTLTLTGTSTYADDTNVNAGTLLVNGDLSGALGTVNVASGATLGGIGTIGGDVNVDGTLAAGSNGIGMLTINGALSLGSGSALDMEFGQANTPGGPLNDLIEVGGDLTLDGTINVALAPGGLFDVGLYRVINYGGNLTNNGLDIGTMPAGSSVVVQTSVAGQVNLVNSAGLALNIWDGAAGPKDDGAVNGGDGTWHLGGSDRNWTDVDGAVNAGYAEGSFAIFSAAAGTVTVDNGGGAVTTSGMQFASDGYVIDGQVLTLVGPQAIVRVGDGTLAGAGYKATIATELTGTSELVKTDLGTLILTGANSYSGGTTVAEGTLQIGNGGTSGSVVGNVTNNAALSFNRSDEVTFAGVISGSGIVSQDGAGTLILTGANSYSGATNVNVGTLIVNGNQSLATGLTSVASGATLGGIGTIGGNVSVADGGALTPGSNGVGILTINGDLALAAGSTLNMEFGQANTVGGALNDLVEVGGDLVLDGTLNVTVPAGGTFGPGIYRVINYGGTLTNNGLSLGSMPSSFATVQTSIAGQVNLLNTGGLTLNFWDGNAGPKFDGVVNGGNGTWQASAGNNNWTDSTGVVNAPYADGTFAIFSAAPGTVTVDNSLGTVSASGMQFASDGYVITGEELTLVGAQAIIRVGDGSVAGAGFDATISAELTGASQLVKTDAGTLILTSANTYTGGTAINGGTLQISSDSNLGDAAGDLSFDGGTLATTASLTSDRDMAFVGAGTISTAADTVFTANGLLSGTGALTKSGTGTLLLTANSAGYTGPINIAAGTLAVQGTVGSQVTIGAAGRLEGTGHVGSAINNGVIAPGMGGFGSLTIDGNYTGGGSLEIETVLGDDASQTDRLVIGGDTSGATEVTVINRDGLGAQTVEGIKIIDVGGASNGTFTLNGNYLYEGQEAMVAGAFAYTLQKNGVSTPTDGDWYLRSSLIDQPETPLYQPGVPVYEAYSDALLKLNDMPTWRQRIGNRQWASDTARNMGIWGRIEVTRHRAEAEASTSRNDAETDLLSLQAGIDRIVHEADRGALVAGLTAHYREAETRVSSVFGDGDIDINGKGLGATLSWYGANGFYADAQAQLTWYDADLESDVLGDLTRGNDGNGQAFSVEVGQQIGSGRLTITPQAQLTYSVIGFDRFTDPNDASVSIDKDASLRARAGISVDRRLMADGKVRGGVYALANVSYELLDGTRTNVSGTGFSRRDDRLWGEIGVGGNYSWGNVSLYGEASATTALGNFGDSYGMKAQAGVRIGF